MNKSLLKNIQNTLSLLKYFKFLKLFGVLPNSEFINIQSTSVIKLKNLDFT